MIRACFLVALGAAEATKTVKIGILNPSTNNGGDVYAQSDLTGFFCPAFQGICASNLAARHINSKDPAVVTTIANLTANVSVELVHYNSELDAQAGLQAFFTMVNVEKIDAVITDMSYLTQFIAMVSDAGDHIPVCSNLATAPALVVEGDFPYAALMRPTDTAAAHAMCNLIDSYGWASIGVVYRNYGDDEGYVDEIRSYVQRESNPFPPGIARSACWPEDYEFAPRCRYCPTVGVTIVATATYMTYTDAGTEADLVMSNASSEAAIDKLATAATTGARRTHAHNTRPAACPPRPLADPLSRCLLRRRISGCMLGNKFPGPSFTSLPMPPACSRRRTCGSARDCRGGATSSGPRPARTQTTESRRKQRSVAFMACSISARRSEPSRAGSATGLHTRTRATTATTALARRPGTLSPTAVSTTHRSRAVGWTCSPAPSTVCGSIRLLIAASTRWRECGGHRTSSRLGDTTASSRWRPPSPSLTRRTARGTARR